MNEKPLPLFKSCPAKSKGDKKMKLKSMPPTRIEKMINYLAAMCLGIAMFVIFILIIGNLLLDKRSQQEKLADFDNAYEQCIERELSHEFCLVFAIEESGLGK